MEDKDIIRMSECHEGSWYWEGKRKLFSFLIEKYAPGKNLKNLDILDDGCGGGSSFKILQKYGRVHGIDLSAKAVAICKKMGYASVKKCSAQKIEYPSKKFDLIVLSDVLEHLPNDQLAMKEVKRVLKRNGIAIITVPAHQSLWSKNDEALHHYRRYSRKQLKALACEFKILKFSAIHFLPYFPTRIFKGLRGSKLEWAASGEGNTFIGKLAGGFLKAYTRAEASFIKYFNLPIGVGFVMVLKNEN